jgi:CheY-like chemotaxis protein
MDLFESNDAAPKILIADDDPYVVRALAERCGRMGFEVDVAKYARHALIKLGHSQIDLQTPDANGHCAQFLDPQKSSTHVVMMLEKPAPDTADSAERFGASYILKGPVFWQQFKTVLATAFAKWAVDARSPGKLIVEHEAVKPEAIKSPQVLLVDDDPSIRKYLANGMEKLGIEPLFAADGTRAFWTARRNEPAVIVSDYYMPNGDAEYLLTRLRSAPETQNIPVIVLSGRPLSEPIKQRLQSQISGLPGATRIIQKSQGASELFDTLRVFCGLPDHADRESAGQSAHR